jgi:hypothetical protein
MDDGNSCSCIDQHAWPWYFWVPVSFALRNEGKALELMDPLLIDSCCQDEFLRYIHIGLLCVQEDANDRPTMSYVVVMLKNETVTLCQLQRAAFSVGRFTDHYETGFHDSANDLSIFNIGLR